MNLKSCLEGLIGPLSCCFWGCGRDLRMVFCHFMNVGSVVGIPWGGGDTQTLLYAKKFVWTFLHSQIAGVQNFGCKCSCHGSHPSNLVKLSLTIFTTHKQSLRRLDLCFYRCLSVHKGGACMARGCAWQGGMHGRNVWVCVHGGRCVWQGGHVWWGMPGDVHGRGCLARGVCGREACMSCTPPADTTATAYSQWVGGTHPTRMHSCLHSCLSVDINTLV